ncbi:Polyketide cyclase / dehydrase and lipid transport [Planctomycetes bacterium MalM25]|nr:Polyketide cyclase / dehydrase and lipid transport [Planctomycetes bacterium MalM25]
MRTPLAAIAVAAAATLSTGCQQGASFLRDPAGGHGMGMPQVSSEPRLPDPTIQQVTHQSETPKMTEVTRERLFDAPPEEVWRLLADYGNVHQYTSVVKHSKHTEGPACGVGAVRQCDVMMGMKLREEIVDWQEGRSLTVKIDSQMPTKEHYATIELEPVGERTKVRMTARYSTKGWVVGQAMDALMMRSFMSRSMDNFLVDLDASSMRLNGQAPGLPALAAR